MSHQIVGRATRMGWKRRKSGDKFEVVIELDSPPGWPINVVWTARPVILDLEDLPETQTVLLQEGK
jgi:hypothetical protein